VGFPTFLLILGFVGDGAAVSRSRPGSTRRSDITMIAVTDNDGYDASGKGHKIGIENEKVVGGAEDLGVACD
jgi:hypothetical protein